MFIILKLIVAFVCADISCQQSVEGQYTSVVGILYAVNMVLL